MGQNSTEVAYGFGQMGSMIVDGTSGWVPPAGMVIVAITSLLDATFHATNGLVSEVETLTGNLNSPHITTNADAHGTGLLAAQTAHNNNGTGHGTGIITIGTASPFIKKGMTVYSSTLCPRDVVSPYYNPYVVLSHDGVTTASGLTVARKLSPNTPAAVGANVTSGSAEAIVFQSEHGQGVGGVEMDASNTIPKGVTIYGRWIYGILTGGTIICYFGK